MNRIVSKLLYLSLLIFALFFSFNTEALTKGFEAISFRPASDSGRYLTVWDSKSLNKEWTVGTHLTYAYRPLQLTENGSRSSGIIDHSIVQHIAGAIGLAEWISLGLELPVGWWINYKNPDTAGSKWENHLSLADINLQAKFIALDSGNSRFGISILPFISIPTGNGEYFFGNGGITGGSKIIVEASPHDKINLSLNAGALFRGTFTFRDMDRGNQLLLGLGAHISASKKLSVCAEVNTQTKLTRPFQKRIETPAEALGGIKYELSSKGLYLTAGAGVGITHGAGAPLFRTFMGLAFKSKPPKIKVEEAKPSTDIVRETIVYFTFDSSTINSESAQKLTKLSDFLNTTSYEIDILGYTDSLGPLEYNEALSFRRSEKVKWFMELQGVAGGRMDAKGLGETNPIGDNKTKEGREKNRRVEFKIKSEAQNE